MMPPPLLYSTNPFLKYFIHEKFYGGVHYVWCSEHFDSSSLGRYTVGSKVPASSNPAGIYRRLKEDVNTKDEHSSKIEQQRASYVAIAESRYNDGDIDKSVFEEISYIVKHASFQDWRPLIYIIPRATVASRMRLVPVNKRAGFGDEYIVPDLKSSEFSIIEV